MSPANAIELGTDVRETDTGTVAIVRARGEVDLSTHDRPVQALRGAAAGCPAGVLLDLSDLNDWIANVPTEDDAIAAVSDGKPESDG